MEMEGIMIKVMMMRWIVVLKMLFLTMLIIGDGKNKVDLGYVYNGGGNSNNDVGVGDGDGVNTNRSDERYKLKYNASQSKLFQRLLPYLLSNFVNQSSAYYTFLIQIIEICQIVFSPVIFKGAVTALEGQIEEHLKLFKQLFPDKNIIPKQHYGIHITSHIISLRPPTKVSRFSFESAHNYLKELAQKQNFKILPVSLAKRHQKM